jgi:hypothetical protein
VTKSRTRTGPADQVHKKEMLQIIWNVEKTFKFTYKIFIYT